MRSSAATGAARQQLQVRPNAVRACRWRSRILPARSARRVPASRPPPRRTSPSSPNCATTCARPTTPIGRRCRHPAAGRDRLGAYAEGKHDEALRAMSAAADAEDKTEKHVVTPGPLAPARELYGYMLLDRGMARGGARRLRSRRRRRSRTAITATPAPRWPPSGWATRPIAKANYEKLIALAGGARASADRPEIARRRASTSRATSDARRLGDE